jgi:hypothetical protein
MMMARTQQELQQTAANMLREPRELSWNRDLQCL